MCPQAGAHIPLMCSLITKWSARATSSLPHCRLLCNCNMIVKYISVSSRHCTGVPFKITRLSRDVCSKLLGFSSPCVICFLKITNMERCKVTLAPGKSKICSQNSCSGGKKLSVFSNYDLSLIHISEPTRPY